MQIIRELQDPYLEAYAKRVLKEFSVLACRYS
jgi:hypothetical protein